jgi:[ribosomal protein S18]-alanine N-acetyltransferase
MTRLLSIRPLAAADAEAIAAWRYPPPYDVYDDRDEDGGAGDEEAELAGKYAFVEDGVLVGFCSFGADGRVPGGSYPDGALDVGIGMRPDLTGRGHGGRYLGAALDFATRELGATRFRATVAEFNQRALRLCEGAGFRRLVRFEGRDRPYWILVREL